MLGRTKKQRKQLNLKQAPGDLLDFMNQYYESGEPEVESEFEYEGTEFEEPDVLPDNNECNGEENNDDGYGISNRNNGNYDESKVVHCGIHFFYFRYANAVYCPTISTTIG